jgi:hypothetical protein
MNSKSRWIVTGGLLILLSIFCGLLFGKDSEKKNLIPAQSISTNMIMDVSVKIDGDWQYAGSTSGRVWVDGKWEICDEKIGTLSVPACTDRIFNLGYLRRWQGPQALCQPLAKTADYLKELKRLKIQRIMLVRDDLPIKEMEALGMLGQFKVLEFNWENVSDPPPNPNVEDIAKMPNLERLDLGDCHEIPDLTPLAKLKKLQSLALPPGTTDAQIKRIQATGLLSRLRELSFDSRDVNNLSFLPEMPYLESLRCRYIHESEMPILQKITTLRTLTSVGNFSGDLHFLEKMPQLENLNISLNAFLGKIDLSPLAKLPRLKNLRLKLDRIKQRPNIELTPLLTINSAKGWRGCSKKKVRIELWSFDFSDYDFSGKDLSGFRFRYCYFNNTNFENSNISGVHFYKNFTSPFHPYFPECGPFLPFSPFLEKNVNNYLLTSNQIKSTWNYKHNRMEGIVLPERIAEELAAEKLAKEPANKTTP